MIKWPTIPQLVWNALKSKVFQLILSAQFALCLCKWVNGVFILMKTVSIRPQDVKRNWYVVDAQDMILGRLSTAIATRLRGKHKPEYTPHVDTGDYIIVINAEKVRVTGRKKTDKMYYHHTGYPGGIRSISFDKLLKKAPERIIQLAVKRMLPRGPLGRDMFRKLKVFAGTEHRHTAQHPIPLTFKY